MSDEVQQGEQVKGRRLSVLAYGADVDSMELAALDEARKFFGPDVRLEVIRDYSVVVKDGDPARRYYASVTVREIP